jgi:hypothetical protein
MIHLRPWWFLLALICLVASERSWRYFMGLRNTELYKAMGVAEPGAEPRVIDSFGADPRKFIKTPVGQVHERAADEWQVCLVASLYGGRALVVWELLVGLGIWEVACRYWAERARQAAELQMSKED